MLVLANLILFLATQNNHILISLKPQALMTLVILCTDKQEMNQKPIGVIHLCPSDDNADGDYVSIHGTNALTRWK